MSIRIGDMRATGLLLVLALAACGAGEPALSGIASPGKSGLATAPDAFEHDAAPSAGARRESEQPGGPKDADADGVPDSADRCPNEPGSKKDHGCPPPPPPDPDTDDDGVLDGSDNCPGAANLGQEDADGDGMGDACDEDHAAPAAAAHGLAGCLVEQDPALCQAALESFANLQDCESDESGLNCAYEVAHDALGVDTVALFLRELFAECAASPAAAACGAIRSAADGGDLASVPVLSRPVPRGDLVYTEAAPATPSAKTADGALDDWMARGTRIGGTDLYEFGEHVYSDFLFDSFGADDGDDARRWAALALLGEASSRTERIDALQQAAGDQLDVPPPVGTTSDRYGDAVNRDDGTDLTEVRWAADEADLYFLARVSRLESAANLVVVVLADTGAGAGMQGLDAGLTTSIFDRALVLRDGSVTAMNLVTGAGVPLKPKQAAAVASAAGYDNALEARLPRVLLERPDGKLRVAVFTARADGATLVPANVAYRFDEPVAIFNERAQALALFAGSVDPFLKQINVADLAAGRTQTARPGFGYHERQFVSGANISRESDTEEGRLQPYGVFVPSAPRVNTLNQARLTFWTHYRGGKAHSGASWTPRLFWQLGEEQGNVVVSPRGRGTSTWYTTRAHQDFFEVFADAAGTGALRQYAAENLPADHEFTEAGLFFVDPARVYISGYSMGGFATYLFAGLYPDLFAAGYGTSGAVTQGAWTGLGPDADYCTEPRAGFDGDSATACFVEANDGRANAQLNYRILENTRYVPIAIHHGTNDELALTPGALRMGARLAELQYQYDATTFLGYEHFTQAIIDEWRDGARYLNLHERPENPRAVTYKVVPALVEAVNEVQLKGWNGGQPFRFNPDGAYWVDGLTVRDVPRSGGADPFADNAAPEAFGRIDAESGRLPGIRYLPVPRSGAEADVEDPYASTPVYSPLNHATPYLRHSLYWQPIGEIAADANTFSAQLVNLSAATLDLPRMGFAGHFGGPIDGRVTSDGATRLTLARVGADMTLCVNGAAVAAIARGADAVADLAAGASQLRLVPGLGASCAGVAPPAASGDAPDYADLCVAFGVPGSAPACGALREAETRLREQCEDHGGPDGFCTLTGGNLHALSDTCRLNDPSEGEARACRVFDALLTGVAGWCRQVSDASRGAQPPELCALIGGVLVSENELRRYEASWVHRALRLQNRLGYGLPLAHATLLHTHNSFNAQDDNTPPTLSGSDFNQYYGVTGQLRMDIRAIELDAHWMPGPDGPAGFQPTLCHAQRVGAFSAGCTTEKPLRAGLQEFRAWLDAHPDEVVLLYIEDNLGGGPDAATAYGTTAQVVEDELGALVYRPADHASTCANAEPAGTGSSWLDVSRAAIAAAGKQVLLITETCAGGAWDGLFHQKNDGNWSQGADGFDGFAYGTCRMSDDPGFVDARRRKFLRVWEDATMVSAVANGPQPRVEPAVMRELVRCGLNLPGVDRLTPADGRLEDAVWSWAEDEPAASSTLNCARHGADGRFAAADCGEARPYACVSSADPDTWLVTGLGAWAFGSQACPAGYRYSVPANGYANEKLKEAKTAAGAGEAWLNYGDAAQDGAWTGDATGAAPGAPPRTGAGMEGVAGDGLLGLLGRFLSGLADAMFAALGGDFGSAQATFTAAVATLAGDAAALASDPPADPAQLAGLSRVLPAAEVANCAPQGAGVFYHYQGALHEHSGYSDGRPGTEPRDYYQAAKDHGLDFMGGTEHSDNADLPMTVTDACLGFEAGPKCLVADDDDPADAFRKWDASLEQARAASGEFFTAFRGFEWTSDRFGHINVYFSRHDWNAKTTEGYAVSMESFWRWFAARPELGGGGDGLGVFNHPGREDDLHQFVPDPAYAFDDFAYRPEADLRMVGIETFGKDDDTYDLMNGAPAGGWYAYALDKGWHVGPVGAEDEHSNGATRDWARPSRAKTILLARDRSEGALREALFARRFYAVAHGHSDLRLSFSGDGAHMGGRVARPAGSRVELQGLVVQGAAAVARVEIVTAGGTVLAAADGTNVVANVPVTAGERWYYLRVVRADGRPIAYSAPIWVRAGGAYPLCGEWLAGDLHVHTTYSHDSYGGPSEVADPVNEALAPVGAPTLLPGDDNTGPDEFYTLGHTVERQFAIAAARGLDYLAITDHNDIRSQNDRGFGAHGVLALPSYENSLAGHAQMHGARRIYENPPAPPYTALADALRADGGVFQVNHPAGESVAWHADADWREARDGSYDGDTVPDAIEVWNITWLWQPPAPSANSLDDAVRYWEGWLDRGARVAATGGSDNHYVATTPIQGNGQPTTWVFATERSPRGVLEGMRAGRTTIVHQPPLLAAPRVVLEADADGDGVYEAMLGGEVPTGAALRARVGNAAGSQLRIVGTGGLALRAPIPAFTPEFEYRFTAPPGTRWVRAEVLEPDAAAGRATVCDDAVGDQSTYCRNRLAVLALSSALYLGARD